MMENLEIRSFNIEFRDGENSRQIEGYGAVYNSRSVDLGGFTEIIAEGAFDGVIERSDVKCYLEHDEKRGILARSRNGKGSLSLELDERGLKYSFDAPNTNLGNEVLEGLRRGDYSQSSFAFTVDSDTWTKEEDGSYVRTINKIGNLYDVSIVANPAYEETSVAVALRSMQAFKDSEEKPQASTDANEPVVEPVVETPQASTDANEPVAEPQVVEETPVVEEDNKQQRNHTNTHKHNIMNKFSLIKAINDVVNNRNINEDALSVIEMGAKEMRKSGLSYSGQIQLPVQEVRADGDALPTDGAIVATVAGQGNEVVATEKLNILAPLYGKSILAEATVMTGLVGNVSIPVYSGTTVGWKGEMVGADNGMGEFDSKELSPKRLTAYVDISKQFLVQDSVGAEEMLRNDIVNALKAKLEQTIFGDAAGDATKPAGIFAGIATEDKEALDYAKAVDFEAQVTDFGGEKKWIMSPEAKAAAKQTTISGEKTDLRLLMDGNEVNGYPVVASSNVAAGAYAFGDFKELVVAQWGALDIVVDPYTLATKNAIRLVINAFFDAVVRRDGAIVVGQD